MNYFNVKIKSKNVTAPVATEIFNRLTNSCKVRIFNYDTGHLFYDTRGLIDITDILTANNITNEDMRIVDEFGAVYNSTAGDFSGEIEAEPETEEA